MKRINIKLTDNEYRALKEVIYNGFRACSCGCIYEEMVDKDIDCDECAFYGALQRLEEIIGGL